MPKSNKISVNAGKNTIKGAFLIYPPPSDKSVPKKLGNVSLVNDNDYIIDFK